MKPYLRERLQGTSDIAVGLPIVREYLQARILQGLQQEGFFLQAAFHGGTCLRILFNLPRYSEDLDFALLDQAADFDAADTLLAIKKSFQAESYRVEVKLQRSSSAVRKAQFRFRGLLHELGLSPLPEQRLSIKLEIDVNPPAHATTNTAIVRRHVDLHVRHHDRASLFAGKLQAVFNRPYIKGRDWYDVWWYLSQSDWPQPNFSFLNAGLLQVNPNALLLSKENWRAALRQRAAVLDWPVVMRDVEPFIINREQQAAFSRKGLLALI